MSLGTIRERAVFSVRVCAVVGAVLLAACGSSEDTAVDGGGSSNQADAAGGQGDGDSGTSADPDCLALCASTDVQCSGPDTESGSGTAEATAAGCAMTVMMPVSGVVKIRLDCTTQQVCVDEAMACLGATGMCYPATFDRKSVSYRLPGCVSGGLFCQPK